MLSARDFRPEDAEDVSRIMYESFLTFLEGRCEWHTPVPPQEYIDSACVRNDRMHIQAFVAEDDGKVVGYLRVSADLTVKVGYLDEIGVDPNTMSRGAGSAMFDLAMEFWKQRNMLKIYTCTASVNLRAQRYYKKVGFKEVGRRKTHFLTDADEISLAFYMNSENKVKHAFGIASATPADIDDILSLLAHERCSSWNKEKLNEYLNAANSIFTPIALIARTEKGKPAGVALLNYYPRYTFAYLDLLMTSREYRHNGIGGSLLNRLEELIHQSGGLRKIALNISSADANNLPFLMRHGFVVEEALDHQAAGDLAEIHLGKFFC